ncbi:hypothetical protein PVNG_05506 [Plasmodium vivax North Korean]|uniref:Variable surface protein n=1 Tax=Plasmodium vivax North Korean TaxID=1035514 RepID=A0A0J9U2C3_PLAVI|nr:hypothetical protein PVNG_05506 [Plasmodium vivax North Korean]
MDLSQKCYAKKKEISLCNVYLIYQSKNNIKFKIALWKKKGCGDQDFYRNYLIAENYLTYLRSNVNARIVENACKYFSYWVYKEMIMEKSYSYSVPELHDIIRQSKNIHICQDYVHNITPEIYLNIKKLIDLHNNFMEVLGGTNSFDCDKAEKLFNLYNGLINTCYLNSDDPFCNGIETIRNGYNKTLINAKDCAPYNFLQPFQKRPEKSANTIATAAITAISFASIMTYKVSKRYR